MGLLDGLGNSNRYYDSVNYEDWGNYQFVSLQDIITNFMYIYVGESKIITKVNRTDVQFHGMRAIQELSYDILRSHKAYEINVPNTLQMVLPQDYVNYTKVTRVDGNGIERVLYPTGKTSNPFAIKQDGNNDYDFGFTPRQIKFTFPTIGQITDGDWIRIGYLNAYEITKYISIRLDVNNTDGNNFTYPTTLEGPVFNVNILGYTQVGIATQVMNAINEFGHHKAELSTAVEGELIITYNDTMSTNVYASGGEGCYQTGSSSGGGGTNNTNIGYTVVDTGSTEGTNLIKEDSQAWTKFKAQEVGDPYADDTSDIFVDARGRRYGLDPQSAQSNGTFFIDNSLGMIHFGSSLVGQDIILKYISDGLGTNEEMIVHKFCEEAVYKWIMYGILSGRAGVPEGIVQRFKKERFAETRKAKIRLSNIKMEEFTQVLKGINKQLK
tara:strand:+ start:261 stop:1577 length:1317 start_codon:yes stop_codon:yes gene_type:complete